MTLLLGGPAQNSKKEFLLKKVQSFSLKPALAILSIGDLEESKTYISQKQKFGEEIGVEVRHFHFEKSSDEKEIIEKINNLNNEEGVKGIIVQIPLPENFNRDLILNQILPEKDVDGLTKTNQDLLHSGGSPLFVPATARGIIELLDFYGISLNGKVVVVGASLLVGKPVFEILKRQGLEVFLADEHTQNIQNIAKEADILITATGVPHLIKRDFIKQGQVIVDAGFSFVEIDGQRKIVGDVYFEEVKDIVGGITPVPGGVGPMTVCALFENLLNIPFDGL